MTPFANLPDDMTKAKLAASVELELDDQACDKGTARPAQLEIARFAKRS
jgi:hypothetical protein